MVARAIIHRGLFTFVQFVTYGFIQMFVDLFGNKRHVSASGVGLGVNSMGKVSNAIC